MVATVKTYQNRRVLGDTSQPFTQADTGVQEAAGRLLTEQQEITNNLLVTHDKARTKAAYNDFNERARNKYQELSAREGADALGEKSVMADYQEWYAKQQSELADSLDNTDQQIAFKTMSDARANNDLDRLSTKEATEHKKYQLSVHKGTISDVSADIMLNFGSDKAAQIGEERIRESFDDTFPGIDTTEAEQQAIAEYRALRIRMLFDTEDEDMIDKASTLLENSKDELKGSYLPLKNELKNAQLIERAQAKADEIIKKYSDPERQLKEARKLKGNLEEKTLQLIKTRQSDVKRYKDQRIKEEQDRITNEAIDIYRSDGTKAQFLKAVDETTDTNTRKELLRLAEFYYRSSGTPTNTDWAKYTEARQVVDQAIQNGEALTTEELIRKYEAYMKPSQFKAVLDYNEKGGNIGGLSQTDANKLFKAFTEKKPEERPEASGQFWDYLVSQLEPGKKPTQNDLNAWATDWFKKADVVEDGGLMWLDKEMSRADAIKQNQFEDFPADEETKKDPLGIRK